MVIGFNTWAHLISCDVVCLPGGPPPGKIKFLSVNATSVVLNWEGLTGLEGPKSLRIQSSSVMKVEGSLVVTTFNKIEINNLQLGQRYFIRVDMEDESGILSGWAAAIGFTGNMNTLNSYLISL